MATRTSKQTRVEPRGVTRKVAWDGLDSFQPGVRVYSCFGPITHWARGVYLTTRKDAKAAADAFARESSEVGYVVI